MEETRPVVAFLRYYLAHDLLPVCDQWLPRDQAESSDTQPGVCDQSVIILTGMGTESRTTFIHR